MQSVQRTGLQAKDANWREGVDKGVLGLIDKSRELVNSQLEQSGLTTATSPLGLALETKKSFRPLCDVFLLLAGHNRLCDVRSFVESNCGRDGDAVCNVSCLWFSSEDAILSFLNQHEDHLVFTDRILKVRGRC